MGGGGGGWRRGGYLPDEEPSMERLSGEQLISDPGVVGCSFTTEPQSINN